MKRKIDVFLYFVPSFQEMYYPILMKRGFDPSFTNISLPKQQLEQNYS